MEGGNTGKAGVISSEPESSQNDDLLDAGRYGLHVLSRHFSHPVGRFCRHDGMGTYYSEFS